MRTFTVVLFSALFLTSCHFKRSEADLVIFNATVYTLNETNSVEQAIAIKDGKIVAVGKDRDILNNFRYSESIDAEQQYIYPGFIDAHCHFVNYGLGLQNVDLKGCRSFAEVLQRLTKFSKANPGQQWIIGRGWDHTDWPGKIWPVKDSLDLLFPDRPVLLHRVDGHAALVNQSALAAAGFSPSTKISGGVLMKANGKLTGLLKENAVDSVMKFIPKPNETELGNALKKAQKNCFAVGLTTVDDAGLDIGTLLMLKKLSEAGQIGIRVYAMASDNPENFAYFTENGAIRNPYLNVSSFKFYADGSLGSRSACLVQPYHDDIHEHGLLTTTPEELKSRFERVFAMNFQANTHAIGDSANREILKLYGDILKGANDHRWRIEHAQVVTPQDLEFFRKFTIIPSIQPTHATSDAKWAADRLGPDRVHTAYAYKKLLKQNGILALGTDAPVEDINPLYTFYSAVFRKNTRQEPEGGFQTEDALTREEALKGMTLWAALANHEENQKGSIEKGKFADLVFMNRDLFKAPEQEVLKAKVIRTMVDGKTVYKD
ncbi:MAG: amidohydrolase [Bacteroidota bacterium]